MKIENTTPPEAPIVIESVKTYKPAKFVEAENLRTAISSTTDTLFAIATVQEEVHLVRKLEEILSLTSRNLLSKTHAVEFSVVLPTVN